MAIVVELMGPPAVGKTHLMRGLARRRRGAVRRVVPVHDLLRVPRPGLPPPLARRFAGPLDPNVLRGALRRRSEEWDDFLMLATNAASAAGVSPLRRLQAVAWTLATLEALAVAMERPADEVVVFDEGPLQRALALIAPGYAPDATGRLVRSAPEVALVLNLRADELTLMRRLDARARAIGRTDRYAGLSRKERLKTLRGDSRLLAEVAVAARAAGRSVIDIDTSDTSPDPVRSILDILGRLEP